MITLPFWPPVSWVSKSVEVSNHQSWLKNLQIWRNNLIRNVKIMSNSMESNNYFYMYLSIFSVTIHILMTKKDTFVSFRFFSMKSSKNATPFSYPDISCYDKKYLFAAFIVGAVRWIVLLQTSLTLYITHAVA